MAIQMRDLENQKRGEKRGCYLERRRTITNMLQRGRTPEYIAEDCDYPLDLVLDVQKGIKAAE